MAQVAFPKGHAPHTQGTAHAKTLLGPLLCWSVVFADIGSSIYYVPGILYASVGGLAGFFVLLTMIVFVLLTLKYAEVSERFPEGGGVVSVAAQGINSWAGALGGMFILVSYFLTAAISCLSALQYFSVVFPALLPYILPVTIGVLVLLGLLNWVGVSESAKVSMVAALLAFGSNLLVLAVVFLNVPVQEMGTLFSQTFSHASLTPASILVGFAGAFLAFSGLESISQLSPVMKAPRRKVIGLALLLVTLSIGVTSPLLTTLSTLLQPEAAGNEVLSTQLISLLGGRWGSTFIQQEVAISASLILIFAGNTAIIGAYHVFLALARMDFLPAFILQRNRIRNSPHYSIALATGIPILVLIIVNGKINVLGDMYAFGLLAAFSLTCLGLDIIRIRERRIKADSAASTVLADARALLNPESAAITHLTEKNPQHGKPGAAQRPTMAQRVWKTVDLWLGILTTALVLLAWVIGIFTKPLGTAFGGAVVLLGMSVAVINYVRQGRTLVLPRPLETHMPDSVLAVLVSNGGRENEDVIESAVQEGSSAHTVVFLYLSDHVVERTPRPFEIVTPYLEDQDAKEAFRQAEREARREGIPRRFVYLSASPAILGQVWRFVQPRDVVVSANLVEHTHEINPDRLRYELMGGSKIAHLVKHW